MFLFYIKKYLDLTGGYLPSVPRPMFLCNCLSLIGFVKRPKGKSSACLCALHVKGGLTGITGK